MIYRKIKYGELSAKKGLTKKIEQVDLGITDSEIWFLIGNALFAIP
jgi:hypothetical protein